MPNRVNDYEKANNFNWVTYYEKVSKNPPRDTASKAVSYFNLEIGSSAFHVLDLGCGQGRDTKLFLEKNWQVLAIDREKAGIEQLLQDVGDEFDGRLRTIVSSFEDLELVDKYDLINSSFALPFCKPEHFPILWVKLREAIKLGGRFSGQLFGIRDEWTEYTDMNFHTKDDVLRLFENFELEYFLEEEKEGPTTTGDLKHWHIFHIIAKKIH